MPQWETLSGNIKGLGGVKVDLLDADTGAHVDQKHSKFGGSWEFVRPATGKYNILFDGRGTTPDDDIYGIEVVDMSEFESSEQFLNDTPPSGIFAAGATPIEHVTNRLEAVANVQWVYTPDGTDKHHGFVVRWEHGPSSGQTISGTSPSRKIDSTARDFAIQIPADDYITIKVYAYYLGVSGTNEDSGYQHATWVDSQATALATLSGWESNPLYLQGGDALLHSSGYLVLGTGNDVIRLDATHATYREWIGHATDPTLAAYAIEKDGTLHATGAIIEGAITATSGYFTGNLYVGASGGSNRILIDGVSKVIGSESFASGFTGWRIDGVGDAEFNNIIARGNISATSLIFQENAAFRGSLLIVKSAAELFEATTATGTTFTIKTTKRYVGDAVPFVNGDICKIASGVNTTWFTVGTGTDQTTHWQFTATYQNGSNSATYAAGIGIADYGVSGDGGLKLTANEDTPPNQSIFTHAGSPWSTTELKFRAGNLGGITDADFGGALSGYGLYAVDAYFKGNITMAGGTFQTQITGKRITINEGINNALIFYDAGGEKIRIDDDIAGTGNPGIEIVGGILRMSNNAAQYSVLRDGNLIIASDSGNPWCIDAEINFPSPAFWTGAMSGESNIPGVDNYGFNRYGVYGKSVLSNASSTSTAIAIYGTATNDGSGKAYAGYFDEGDVYIQNNLGIGTTSPGVINGVDITSQHVLHNYSASLVSRVVAEGSSAGVLDLIDRGGAGDQKWVAMAVSDEHLHIGALDDSAGIAFDLITADLSNGNVGIGTDSPDQRLDITGLRGHIVFDVDTYANIVIMQTDDATGSFDISNTATGGDLRFYATEDIYFRTASADPAMTILKSGNVGIGTDGPVNPLDVVVSGVGRGIGISANSPTVAGAATLDFFTQANRGLGSQIIGETGGTGGLAFWVNTGLTKAMTMLSSGNVGIGIIPQAKLHVDGGSVIVTRGLGYGLKVITDGGGAATIRNLISSESSPWRISIGANTGTVAEIRFSIDGYTDMMTLAGGALTVNPNVSTTCAFGFVKTGSPWNDFMAVSHYDHMSQTNYALMQEHNGTTYLNSAASQGVWIRSNNADVALFSTGSLKLFSVPAGSQTYFLKINASDGRVVYESSSIRHKENIRDYAGAAADQEMDNVLKLTVREFERIETGKTNIGLVAEEVNEILPKMVGWKNYAKMEKEVVGGDGHFKKVPIKGAVPDWKIEGIDMDRLHFLTFGVLKRHDAFIKTLQPRISTIEGRLFAAEQEITELKNRVTVLEAA